MNYTITTSADELTETWVVTRWVIFGVRIDLHNLSPSSLEINNDVLTLLQTGTFAIYLTMKT